MLNDLPKKEKKKKDYSNPTKWQLFWRIQKECLRRAVTPYLMYLFMSLLMLSCQAIANKAVAIVLGIFCVAGGAFFNGHLCYHYGILHYGAYAAGCLHRKNAAYGIQSGGDHRPEREYRIWKGPLIGLYIGIPVMLFGILAGSLMGNAQGWMYYAFAMFAGYAIIPITWFGTKAEGGLAVSPYWAILFVLLSVIVSAIFYYVGAMHEKKTREEAASRAEQVEEAGKRARNKK